MKKIIEILILSILLGGCSMNEVPKKLIPKKADKFAKNYIDSLKNGKTDYCFNKLDEQYQNKDAKTFYLQAYENLKDKKLISNRIVNAQTRTVFYKNKTTTYNLSYEYEYSENFWIYYNFQLLEKEKNNDFVVKTFNIQPTDKSLSETYKFSFENKSFIYYLWLFFSILIPLFIIITVIFSIRTPLKRKWIWIIFILIGFSSFSLNWTTGEIGFQLIRFSILGAGIVKSGIIAPWIVSFSIPLGAIIFWFKRKEIINKSENKNNDTTTKNIRHLADSAKYEDDSSK